MSRNVPNNTGITIEINNNSRVINDGFFDEKFGKWEDDVNSPLHRNSKLQSEKDANDHDQNQERKTHTSRGSSRSNSSRRARNSRQGNNNFSNDNGGERTYSKTSSTANNNDQYSNYTMKINPNVYDKMSSNSRYNNNVNNKNKKWKKATSPRIIVNGNMQTLKIGFNNHNNKKRNAKDGSNSPNGYAKYNGDLTMISSFSTSPLRPFSRMRERDLLAQIAKQEDLKSFTSEVETSGSMMDLLSSSPPKKSILTVKFSTNKNRNRDKYANKKIPPGPLWGKDAYYKPKVQNKTKNRKSVEDIQLRGHNKKTPPPVINVPSVSGNYKSSYVKEIKSYQDVYIGANINQHAIHPILEANVAVEKVQRILNTSRKNHDTKQFF